MSGIYRIRYVDGYTESLWKSLAVKALRLGWPAGLQAAALRLPPSAMQSVLVCGTFEDVFPAIQEVAAVKAEIEARDYRALCARQTHHGRGLTPGFCDFEVAACNAAKDSRAKGLVEHARQYGLSLPPRCLNCYYTWMMMAPRDAGQLRQVDEAPWAAIPLVCADAHTIEGKRIKQEVTLLSGHYAQHRRIGARVMAEGWEPIRAETHAAHYRSKKDQATLFSLDR